VLREIPLVTRVRDNWGEDRFDVKLNVNADRANLAGITNMDIADSAASAVNGTTVTTLREGDKQIPVVARLRTDEIAGLNDLNSLYVYSRTGK
jgi:multidrug efflux pump subunit AcrB